MIYIPVISNLYGIFWFLDIFPLIVSCVVDWRVVERFTVGWFLVYIFFIGRFLVDRCLINGFNVGWFLEVRPLIVSCVVDWCVVERFTDDRCLVDWFLVRFWLISTVYCFPFQCFCNKTSVNCILFYILKYKFADITNL